MVRKSESGRFVAGCRRRPLRPRRIVCMIALSLLVSGGCAGFQKPLVVEQPARDFLVRVKNQRGAAFERVQSARKGKGPYDVQVTLTTGWSQLKKEIRQADALTLARAWVVVIRPVKPKKARIDFVDDNGNPLAWGVYQTGAGLFVDLGRVRAR